MYKFNNNLYTRILSRQNFIKFYSTKSNGYSTNESIKIPSPKILKNHLDNYIIGQDLSKKVISVAVYNHYLRINQKHDDLELHKSNILLLGPSGSGKTLIAKTLAKIINVPYTIIDCTQLTQTGYIGDNVEICIEKLLINSNYDSIKTSNGIIILDEIDKLSKPLKSSGLKDISGEGVQQSLLKLIEGTNVHLQIKKPIDNNKTSSKNFIIDTSNILFISMGAFVGLDNHITKRLIKSGISINNDEILNYIKPQDLINYGIIPELIGRIPIITGFNQLNQNDLLSILTEPKNSLINQYKYIFKQFNVELIITKLALIKISKLAYDEGIGARGLRSIMERLLLHVNYECPDNSKISIVLIDSEFVDNLNSDSNLMAKYYSKDEIFKFIEDLSKEDEQQAMEFSKENNI
ncbi:hypothetical protein WICMUC_000165 [Wickerhamomyces mucosus]|uniref:AAA+ ATPase domain-containing protein n=1 Tax=Wickerhamomyces mucosus TaxID=1378264 RepID=A0A9P8Q0Y3_9ASCO|nr:hypothetical protein WICMUC_000165 [Wickerhamomyces mucosus]